MSTISNGQTLDVTMGQSLSGILVLGGGTLLVHSGGSVSGTTLDTQADAVIYAGGTADATAIDGGLQDVYGSSNNATVDAGAQVVYGTTTDTALSGTGIQQVYTGGTASGTVVGSAGGQGNSGPVQVVGFGGTSIGTIVNAGGVQDVQSTGIAHDTTVNSGGDESISNGGTAVDATIQSGGNVDVYDGTLGGSVVDNGTLTFWASNSFSGQLSGTGSVVLGDGALLLSGADNFAGNIAINGETLELGAASAAGVATITFTGHAGTLQIDGTSMPSNTVLGFTSGDLIDLAGISFDSAGSVQLAAGNVLQITEGGHLYQLQLDPNASFAGTTFGIFADAASGTYVTLGQQPISDTLAVSSGQMVSDILVLDAGTLHVLSGGTASATMIEAGGSDLIDVGGAATGTIIIGVAGSESGGVETVLGSASGTTVLNGGLQDVWGTATGTTVSGEFSFQEIESGGSAIGTTLDGGGSVDGSYQSVLAGGLASGTIVNQGGDQIVQAGGIANGTVVNGGGLEEVCAGGTTNDTTIEGGTLALDAGGGTAGGTITFVGTGGALYVGDAASVGATIDGFSQGNIICVDGAYTLQSTVQLLAGNVLQVVTNSVTYDLQLDPNADFSGQTFKIASDGANGTEVYLVQAPVPTSDPPAPVVADIVLNPGQTSVAASALFTASDPDGDTIATYAFEDTGNGHFVLNGVVQANNQEIDVTAAQLSRLIYQGAAGTEDLIQVRVSDGNQWSDWASFKLTAPPLAIESQGSTNLVELGDNYFLDDNGSGTGPELKSGGMAVVAGQSGNWTPIAAEQTASGYEVAWHNTFTGNYKVWNTDSSGNVIDTVSGSLALESREQSFHQDLNGDGVIGAVSTTLQTDGSTELVQVGNNYYLDDVGSGIGPSLKLEGEEYVADDPAESWTPIGAVEAATGYDIALKWGNYYSISTADSNGNFTSFAQTQLLGGSLALESWEASFNQDLNGDGTIGVVSTTIQTDGPTSLVEACGNLYFDAVGGAVASGPSLKYGGFDFSVDQTNWVPIGAVQTATGYQIAWELPGGGQYMVWNTDSNGNYVANAFSASNIWANVSGSNVALESLEVSFHQDLNGDGVVGILATIEQSGATKLVGVGNDYFFDPVAGGTGPELTYGGTPFVAGAWTPIGAEKTSTGYEVALFKASSHLYTIWDTDGSGNVLSSLLSGVTGSNTALQSMEVSFAQDLNGDGTIGVPGASGTVIETHGAIQLVQAGNNYFFEPAAGGTGPELTYGGTPFVAAAWTPIGAEKTSTGYEVALFNASSHLYTIWDTDSSGNVLSSPLSGVTGSNTALESIEVSFAQDLNGDGTIGVPGASGTIIETHGATELVQAGNNYFFDPVAGGTGPELTYGGAPFVAGAWTPIGAEKTSTGYEVALFNASSHLYTIWNTDGTGSVLSSPLSGAIGSNTALQSIEVSFAQDLNGDGTIGVPGASGTIIETHGATQLVQVANDYFFDPVAGGTGPELTYGGAPFVAGAWTPIGAEKTSTGYEVALFNASSHLYTIWDTDGAGSVLSSPLSGVTGSNAALESVEVGFAQDLNGDNVIGPASQSSAAAASAVITAPSTGNVILSGSAAADTFVFNAHFGNDTVTGLQPGVDQVDLEHILFASVEDLFSHTADNAGGSGVISVVGTDQSVTLDSVPKSVLQQHASDFHLV